MQAYYLGKWKHFGYVGSEMAAIFNLINEY